jgi:two-component system response regulator AtoC
MDRALFSELDLGGATAESSPRLLSIKRLAETNEQMVDIVGGSPQIRRVFETIKRFAPYREGVLIQGESGTGKELVARALHAMGPVPNGPFVTFNCSNLVPSLAESQLFGHVRGAFTDAREDSLGYFRSANGGTLFLDEVGELPLELQPKLLRAVENHEVQPVGSTRSYRVEIRVIAATNRDLRAMMKEGRFRDDLYYRLNTAAVAIPPLRDRVGDVGALLGHFVERFNAMLGKQVEFISPRALSLLEAYPWPGNVREFSNSIQSALMMTDDEVLDVDALPENISMTSAGEHPAAGPAATLPEIGAASSTMTLNEAVDEAARRALERALRAAGGNCHRAADLLGVSRYTVYRMLTRYRMAPPRSRMAAATAPNQP